MEILGRSWIRKTHTQRIFFYTLSKKSGPLTAVEGAGCLSGVRLTKRQVSWPATLKCSEKERRRRFFAVRFRYWRWSHQAGWQRDVRVQVQTCTTGSSVAENEDRIVWSNIFSTRAVQTSWIIKIEPFLRSKCQQHKVPQGIHKETYEWFYPLTLLYITVHYFFTLYFFLDGKRVFM